ncbi:MAG: CbtA family protein [Gammaproteobacteria bacterium]|nr:CbtA family protein [Gammaproteobacteria bacterium]
MLFRRLILLSLFVGLLSGSFLTAVQQWQVTPIIIAAEQFEQAEAGHGHNHGAHSHGDEAWAPAEGVERTLYSLLSNVLAAIGFAAMLLALMAYMQLKNSAPFSLGTGLLWGLVGFLTFFVAPSLGLLPEIPGTQAAALESRQTWWLLTVLVSGAGFYLLFFAQLPFKVLGVLLLLLPHLIGAPQLNGPEFIHPDPAAVASLVELHHQFVLSAGVANLLFWLAMGLLAAWGLRRGLMFSTEASQ